MKYSSKTHVFYCILCRTRKRIKAAIQKNTFLGDLDEIRIEKIISAMYPKTVKGQTRLIHQGETGE